MKKRFITFMTVVAIVMTAMSFTSCMDDTNGDQKITLYPSLVPVATKAGATQGAESTYYRVKSDNISNLMKDFEARCLKLTLVPKTITLIVKNGGYDVSVFDPIAEEFRNDAQLQEIYLKLIEEKGDVEYTTGNVTKDVQVDNVILYYNGVYIIPFKK